MKIARLSYNSAIIRAFLLATAVLLAPALGAAEETVGQRVQFQKPGSRPAASGSTNNGGNPLRFRSSTAAPVATATAPPAEEPIAEQAPEPQVVAKPIPKPAYAAQAQIAARPAPVQNAVLPSFAQPSQHTASIADYRVASTSQNRRIVSLDGSEPLSVRAERASIMQAGFCEACNDCAEPACGISEPACGCAEPTCGVCEPGCGVQEPGCGIVEPGCGIDDPDCGSCVGAPGPDYICFPVCLPRFKDLQFWGGVHGFKGPRDAPALGGSGDGNFGFQEGLNIGGRAPLVGLLFPQISYQLGYQSVQSQLSGRSNGATNDRLQQFATGGFFRRVPAGLQFGAVWDYMRDDFISQASFNQVRYEISLKGQSGLEAGFWGATHANDAIINGLNFQTVDQYDFFLRYHFGTAAEARLWGGFTNDHEGIFGGDFYAPFNNRWSMQTSFNYLIPQNTAGAIAAQNESWNVGINLVWHYGNTARKSLTNPHRALFNTADNGTMFVDQRP